MDSMVGRVVVFTCYTFILVFGFFWVIYYLDKIFSLLELMLESVNDIESYISFEEYKLSSPPSYKGTSAEVLHPLIQNLPHDNVKTKYDLSSYEEVAE